MATIHRRNFLGAKMEKDADERLLKDGVYKDALNIRLANSESSNVGAIEKSYGNQLVSSISIGNNVHTICTYADEFSEKIYRLLKSDNGCYLVEFDVNTEETVIVLQDTRSVKVLDLNENYLITGIELIIDSDNGNKLLVFSDDYTSPKCVNIERAKTYGENGFEEEDILLIKKPPLFSPTIVLNENTEDEENNIEEKFLRFAYRFKYLDNEYSALSPFSDLAFKPKTFNYNYATGENESMVNLYSRVYVSFNTGSKRVTDIQIVFKESKNNTVYAIETYNKITEGWRHNEYQSVLFNNNKIFRVLPEKELNRFYDNVPLLAKSLAVIKNQIIFGNYTENYNLTDAYGYDIKIQLKANLIANEIEYLEGVRSLKSNRDYETAIAYIDDYGRMTTPLTSNYNNIHIPNSNSAKQNLLQLEITHKAPTFAKYYRIFVKQTKDDYEIISPTLFYEDGAYRWIKLEEADKDKVKEGDILIVKSDSQGFSNSLIKVKVLEVSSKDANFITNSDASNGVSEIPGLYFKIKPEGFSVDIDDYENYILDTYHNSKKKYHDCIRDLPSEGVADIVNFYGDGLNDLSVIGTSELNNSGRFTIEIDGTGASDTFKWHFNYRNTQDFYGENVPITGESQMIYYAEDKGVEIKFDSLTGHTVDDRWTTLITDEYPGGSGSDYHAYGFFRTTGDIGKTMTDSSHTVENEIIEVGSRIQLEYNESNNGSVAFNLPLISNGEYANIMEWYYEENVGAEILKQEPSFDLSSIFFVRGVLWRKESSTFIKYDADGYMTMMVKSQNSETLTKWTKVYCTTTSFQSIGDYRLILETQPKDLNTDIYYEVGRTYEIENGNHLGFDANDTSQTSEDKAILNLDVFNCFAWGNGFESYKVKDLFNENSFNFDTRALTTIDNYRQNKRIASFTWSQPFEQSTNYNGLNEFNLSLVNYYDLDDSYGSVQKIISYDTDLDVWQEDKVHKMLYGKSVMYNQDGSSNVSKSNETIGGVVSYSGEFGISKNPESLTKYGNYTYWTDKNRGVVLRKGKSGIEIISNFGMKDWFRDLFRNQYLRILGGYDPYFSQYILNIKEVAQESLDEITVVKMVIAYENLEGLTVSSNYKWIENNTNSEYYKKEKTLEGIGKEVDERSTGEQGKGTYPKNNSTIVLESFKDESEDISNSLELGYLITNESDLSYYEVVESATYLTNHQKTVNNGVLTYSSFNFNRTNELYLYLIWFYKKGFESAAISELVQKDDCGVGYTGSTVVYSIAEGLYMSNTSQEFADNKARTYFDDNKQAYANLNGDCIADSVEGETQFLKLTTTQPDIGNNGVFYLINGEPNEEITLEFDLTHLSDSGEMTFNSSSLIIEPLDIVNPLRDGVAILDSLGGLTVPYSIEDGVSCRARIKSRSSNLLVPISFVVIDNLENDNQDRYDY